MKTYNSFLFEKVGVNEDVVKLADFVSDYIYGRGREEGSYIIKKKDIPDDIDLPINKLTVVYEPKVFDRKKDKSFISGYLDPRKSKRFKSGNVEIWLKIRTLKKSVLYHEFNHVLQFIKLGRSGMIKKGRLSFLHGVLKKDFKDKKVKDFLYLLYRADENEMYSNIVQFYGQLKGLMKKYIKKFKLEYKDKKTSEELDGMIQGWKKNYFIKTLHNRDIYLTAKFMEDIDLQEFFEGADEDEVKKLFSLLPTVEEGGLGKIRFKMPDPEYFVLKKQKRELDVELLSDEEIEGEINKYQTTMNTNGKKMRLKLSKIWYLLEDIK